MARQVYNTDMLKKKTVLRFILGLKIRQLRARRGLSLKELAETADLSISYLNEIENGKKYPKIEKLAALAQGLGVDLGDLVSFKTGRNLHPLLKFLESEMVSKVPLELFGLSESDVVDLMGHDPEKFASFVLTVLQISRSFDMKMEDVYTAALRSFIEANENYFVELEKLSKKMRHDWGLQNEGVTIGDLINIIEKKYHYNVDESALSDELLNEEKFLVKRSAPFKIFLNPKLDSRQKAYYVAKELGHLLNAEDERPAPDTLGAKLLDFKTSYFAGALLLEEKLFSKDLKVFFSNPHFAPQFFISLLDKYQIAPDVLFHRLTQVLPSAFKVNELFFLKVSSNSSIPESYAIEQELHLAQLHSPHGVRMYENYCRRWVAVKSIQQLKKSNHDDYQIVGQISVVEDGQGYFSISLARKSSLQPEILESLTIGFLINDELKSVIKFLDDKNLKHISIGQTCERCPKENCEDRVATARIYQQEVQKEKMARALLLLSK